MFPCYQDDRAAAGVGRAGPGGGESDDVHPPHLLQCGRLGSQAQEHFNIQFVHMEPTVPGKLTGMIKTMENSNVKFGKLLIFP